MPLFAPHAGESRRLRQADLFDARCRWSIAPPKTTLRGRLIQFCCRRAQLLIETSARMDRPKNIIHHAKRPPSAEHIDELQIPPDSESHTDRHPNHENGPW